MTYRALFKAHIDPETLTVIRETTNQGRALGSWHFQQAIKVPWEGELNRSPAAGTAAAQRFRKISIYSDPIDKSR